MSIWKVADKNIAWRKAYNEVISIHHEMLVDLEKGRLKLGSSKLLSAKVDINIPA